MFVLNSDFTPTGDQPTAIAQLVEGIKNGEKSQVLLGVTGSGKTFTVSNVIEQVQKPTLVLTHNKTLVSQLYGEFRQFFPDSAVEYFVSYYDYYQPEAFIASTGTFIEKEMAINAEIEKLRLRTTMSLMSGRRDVIVVASISCIYGMGNPAEYSDKIIRLKTGDALTRQAFLFALVDNLYARTTAEFTRGTFRVKGDTVDVFLAYADYGYRIVFFGNTIETLETIDPTSGRVFDKHSHIAIFPANLYVTSQQTLNDAIVQIQDDLVKQMAYFNQETMIVESKRIEERVNFDIEMMRELGYCSGIENYSRYLDGRQPGDRPFCLLDYFPKDFLLVIDESHVSVPQVRAMYGGDRSRKVALIDNGFRLPSAMDNRPLLFDEFENLIPQVLYVSATPADYELQQTQGVVVEQVIRPTGLLDPPIEIRPVATQVDDLLHEATLRIQAKERVLVTTLTKRMAEELSKYMTDLQFKCRYIHSDVDTLQRVEILRDLRLGEFDILIGVNLLREGLDLPEVSLVAILDADKEGFLRSERSLTQTAGRAARNVNGKVIMYANKITNSMQKTIDETNRRRIKQTEYNELHNITPKGIIKTREEILKQTSVLDIRAEKSPQITPKYYTEPEAKPSIAADPIVQYMNTEQIQKLIKETKKTMENAAKTLDFVEAARLRDEMYELQKLVAVRN